MSGSNEVKLLNLAEAEKEKDSDHLSDKYGPQESFSPVEPPAEKNEPMSETSGINLSSDAAKKKEEGGKKEEKTAKRTAEERERDDVLRALTSFLPRNKRKEAVQFLHTLLNDPKVEIKRNLVFHEGKPKGHVSAALSRIFLQASSPHEKFFEGYLPLPPKAFASSSKRLRGE